MRAGRLCQDVVDVVLQADRVAVVRNPGVTEHFVVNAPRLTEGRRKQIAWNTRISPYLSLVKVRAAIKS